MEPALSALRFPDGGSLGRRHKEPPHPYRTEFQRDRDRIVHARAFRRLEDKTQVFTPALSDHFRNRLTHTIEVAQIARTAAAALGLNEPLTEAMALAHDIGHPPFAHAGFDHNLHALRIVESFERRYAAFPGLNLTFEVREGIAKHSRDFSAGEFPELDEYLPGLRPPLEAQLIDLADEIAYNTADLDDSFAAGLFELDDVAAAVPAYRGILESASAAFPGAPPRVLFQETLRPLIDLLVSGLIEGTWAAAADAGAGSVEDVRRHPGRLACLTPDAAGAGHALKRFLRHRVYFSADLLEERERASAMLGKLFQYFLEHPEELPAPQPPWEDTAPLHRRVCDYIAGMTDGYFRRVYARTVNREG